MGHADGLHRRSFGLVAGRDGLRCAAGLEMRAMAVEFPVVHGHPNRLPFEGVLTLVDVASDKAPSGARGHRVVLTREAAEAALLACWEWLSTTRRDGMGMMRGRSAASLPRLRSMGKS